MLQNIRINSRCWQLTFANNTRVNETLRSNMTFDMCANDHQRQLFWWWCTENVSLTTPRQLRQHGAQQLQFNPSQSRNNYIATSNDMELVHWPLMGGLLHLVKRRGDWAGPQPAQSPLRCTKYNSPLINGQCTNHRTAAVRCSVVLVCALKG